LLAVAVEVQISLLTTLAAGEVGPVAIALLFKANPLAVVETPSPC